MDIRRRISAFSELGKVLRNTLAGHTNAMSGGMIELINNQYNLNPWFTPENVRSAVAAIAAELTADTLIKWTDGYNLEGQSPFRTGIIMAGNIPLAGFHDFLSVLISGNHVVAKTSSKDPLLIVEIAKILRSIEPEFEPCIEFTDGQLKNFDAVIATGSNNSSRYFEYYFGRYPNIIRKNRNSIAIIDGTESTTELEGLGTDIFRYFGLGCRNVSKLYLPAGYYLNDLTGSWSKYKDIVNHPKYVNNYDYNKAVLMVNRQNFTDTGFVILREDSSLSSPVAVLHYEFYRDLTGLNDRIARDTEKIQCVMGHNNLQFGTSQSPCLWDYADGIDTLHFLSKKNASGIL